MRRARSLVPLVGVLPFFAYLGIFLLIPTVVVTVGAFQENGSFSLSNVHALTATATVDALRRSVGLSGSTAGNGGPPGGPPAGGEGSGPPAVPPPRVGGGPS